MSKPKFRVGKIVDFDPSKWGDPSRGVFSVRVTYAGAGDFGGEVIESNNNSRTVGSKINGGLDYEYFNARKEKQFRAPNGRFAVRKRIKVQFQELVTRTIEVEAADNEHAVEIVLSGEFEDADSVVTDRETYEEPVVIS